MSSGMNAAGAVPISRLSLQYLTVPVNATRGGAPYNPTADVVQFAFVNGYSGSVPTSGMWVGGSWATMANLNYPYMAQVLIGPGGATAPTTGVYTVWMKIQDNPEVPVLITGMVQVI